MLYEKRTFLCLLLCILTCCSENLEIPPVEPEYRQEDIIKVQGINKDNAIEIARKDALSKGKNLEKLNIIPCEQVLFWRIIFDGGGFEYVIDKTTSSIITIDEVTQSHTVKREDVSNSYNNKIITNQEAIKIAKQDVKLWLKGQFDPTHAVIITCEQTRSWRVLFDYILMPNQDRTSLPNARFPSYLIDKQTGKILYKEIN